MRLCGEKNYNQEFMLRLAYNTNGFAHHKLEDALHIIADLGYVGVGLTLDNYHSNPYTITSQEQKNLKKLFERLGLSVVIETGARYLLDPYHKHEPTLISINGREKRIDFLKRAIDLASEWEAEALTFFSGIKASNVSNTDADNWLLEGCIELTQYAINKNVQLAFEPEPGMWLDTLSKYAQLRDKIQSSTFGLTLDIGHVYCNNEISLENSIYKYYNDIKNIHLEDIKGRIHNHLCFGDGDIDFLPFFNALKKVNYTSLMQVELSRDSHSAVKVARFAMEYLTPYI